ncbi:type II toxin-antitoxin system RelE family toxin [Streptomyces sp. NPDC054835]|uniref:type II toxin-antitoxin system RelE family toxin n=1 Tax=Streptomyces exfoliatus TaxID=1905 RepID=UPI0004664C03|nr:hypothetical protein [Streptomyces exfoliatus]
MTSAPKRPRYALSFHPESLNDLRDLPQQIRERALDLIDGVIRARVTGPPLDYELRQYRKLYLGAGAEWRIVYRLQKAPPTSPYAIEAHVVAVRPRAHHEVYDVVRSRVGRSRPPAGPRVHAARAIPPQLQSSATQPATKGATSTAPALPWRPADLFTPPTPDTDSKGHQR